MTMTQTVHEMEWVVMEEPTTYDAEGEEQDKGPRCQMCGGPMPKTSPRAGQARKFCGVACKQAHHRMRKGSEVAERETGRADHLPQQVIKEGIVICAASDCELPAALGKNRRHRKYCSDQCRQRHKMRRQRARKRGASE